MNQMLKKILMGLAVVIVLIIIKSIMPVTSRGAYNQLHKHLENKYGEEFIIPFFGERTKGSYEGIIYPKSYIGTRKQYDKYYEATGYFHKGKPGDNYNKVLTTESTNEYFRPKLEELFGKNILPLFQYEITWKKSTFKELKEHLGDKLKLEGAIYIFGSIKDEKDIEKYQKGIFDFVQYLKETDNFNYTKIAFIVIDERVLEDDFDNLRLKYKLTRAKEESKTEEEFLAKRDKIMSQIEFTNKDKSEKIEGINRGEMDDTIGHFEYFGYTSLMGTTVISPLMIKSNMIYQRMYPNSLGKTYEKKEEIELHNYIKYFFRRN